MKKRLTLIALVLVFTLALSACGCRHATWIKADCETAKTCEACGKTQGEPLGHNWKEATCETPKTCENCGRAEGAALGHSWLDATTEAPMTCENCGLTEGERIITDPRFTTAATADIQGTWRYTVEIDGELMGDPEFDGALSMSLILELKNDGTMSVHMELGDLSAFRDYMLKSMYAEFEAEGLDKAAADAAILESTGMTAEEYVDYMLKTLDFNALFGAMNINGVYYVEGDQLYGGMSWNSELTAETFYLEGDTLTLVETLENGETSSVDFVRVTDGE